MLVAARQWPLDEIAVDPRRVGGVPMILRSRRQPAAASQVQVRVEPEDDNPCIGMAKQQKTSILS